MVSLTSIVFPHSELYLVIRSLNGMMRKQPALLVQQRDNFAEGP